MPRRIDELFYDITARTGGFTRGIGSAQRGLAGFVGKIGGATIAIAAFGAAAVAAGIKATRMAAALDASLREVSTLLPGTVENVSRLRDEVVALSTEVPQTPELLSRGLYQVISAGISDTAEAMDVLRVSARAAVAGLTDTFTSVDAITTVLNAYQLETSEASRVSDVFFATLREGKLTFEDIAGNIGGVATSAALAGVSIEEVGAAMATLTKFGIGTAEATTSLNRLFLSLTNVSDGAAEAAQRMGIELSTAALRSKGLVGFLQDLERATGGNIDALSELIPEIRAARGVFVLAGQGADEYRRILDQTNEASGASGDAFDKMNGSLENQATLLKNRINATWLELGQKTLPLVLSFLEKINTLLETDAERLAAAFRVLGDEARAASIILAESRRQTTEEFAETARTIEDRIDDIIRANERLRAISGGATPLARLPEADVEALFPTGLRRALAEGSDATREMLENTIEHAETLAQRLGPEREREVEALAELVEGRRELLALLDQQAARVRSLRTGDEGADAPEVDTPDPTATLTEAERKALDLRDALLSADEVLRQMDASGADLLSEVPGIIGDLQNQLEDLADGLDADFDAFSLDARLLAAQRAIEGVTRSGASLGEQALAIEGILSQWNIEVDDLPEGFREVVRSIIEVRGETEDVGRELREIINDISFAARGAVELASAFGLVGDEAAAAANQIALIGEGIGRIAAGDILAGIGGVASGLAGLVDSFSGPSETQRRQLQIQAENNRRLRTLAERMDILADVLSGVPGRLAQGFQNAFQAADLTDGPSVAAFDRLADALGTEQITVADLERLAEIIGVNVDDLLTVLRLRQQGQDVPPALVDLDTLRQAEALYEAINRDVVDLGETIAGRLSFLQREFDRFDIDTPAEQLARFADELGKLGVEGLSAADLQRIREGDEDLIEELLRQATSGTGRFTSLGDFGALTQEQLVAFLDEIEGVADRLADTEIGAEEGDFQQVSAINRLTVEQGDTLIAMAGTRNFLLERLLGVTEAGSPVQVTDTMLAAASSVRHIHEGRIDVSVSGDAVDVEGAALIRDGLVDALSLNRDLGAELRNERAGLGLPPTRTQ